MPNSAALLAVAALVSCALPAGSGELSGRIRDDRVKEASGLVASRRHHGVLWTHNDSGGEPCLYAIDKAGRVLAEVLIEGVRNRDWEDIAADDEGNLWVADIGNNGDSRRDLAIYGIREPARIEPRLSVRPDVRLRIRYPDQWEFPPLGRSFDAEALFTLHGRLYLLTKERFRMTRYRVPGSEEPGETPLVWIDAVFLGDTSNEIGEGVTACDVSPDGRRLAVLTYGEVLFFTLPSRPDDRLLGPTDRIRLNPRRTGQAEGLAWTEEGILIVNEDSRIFHLDLPSNR